MHGVSRVPETILMASKMLIDAAHPEETRVVVVRGNRVEEFDFETKTKKPLRGNIFLAKVTRVEPSLQAAFVDYGGNRHGFLAFSEIHPDYYQIPVADREMLLAEQAAEARYQEEEDARLEDVRHLTDTESSENASAAEEPAGGGQHDENLTEGIDSISTASDTQKQEGHDPQQHIEPETDDSDLEASQLGAEDSAVAEMTEEISAVSPHDSEEAPDLASTDRGLVEETGGTEATDVESVGAEDAFEELPERHVTRRRKYKIQEVVKRKQIVLVQVVKEERGNKGAALTTYLSLAGRYCVLMPNTARGGGISRKITNPADRKRLKEVAQSLEVPDGTGLIIRTAGANRTKVEIKRDFEYLIRLWENIRELTLQSTAPALIYEEGNLIKRSIRDLYTKDIDTILVEGEEGYKQAKDFMRMLMPSHAKNVQRYKDRIPLLQRYQVQPQLDSLFSPQVQLKSGGYLVINPTEALVSIDVNSGRSTREHNIEDTALKTNLEAADEIARQLRLRDLAGLVVIDFIDMDYGRNNRAVERRLKECLKTDRARIQVGRISPFGLLEMSRQRLRSSLLEGSSIVCPTCHGTGVIRSVESLALQILRAFEEEGLRGRAKTVTATMPSDVALYILNQKRAALSEIEQRFSLEILIHADGHMAPASFNIETSGARSEREREPVVSLESGFADQAEEEAAEETLEPDAEIVDQESAAGAEDDGENESEPSRRRRRRRRGRRGGQAQENTDNDRLAARQSGDNTEEDGSTLNAHPDDADDEISGGTEEAHGARRRRRRRRRRSGRGRAGQQDVMTTPDSLAAESGENRREPSRSWDDAAIPGNNDAPRAVSSSQEIPEGHSLADNGCLAGSRQNDRPTEMPQRDEQHAIAGIGLAGMHPKPQGGTDGETDTPAPRRRGWWQRRRLDR
jgi:ribonuclease E